MFRPASILLLPAFAAACSIVPTSKPGDIRQHNMEEAVASMAAAALSGGQVETANRLYRRLIEVDPESVAARMGLGDVALRQREPVEAARWYRTALVRAVQGTERHAALLAHGRAALSAGQIDAARDSFEQLTDPRAGAPRTYVAWGHNGLGLARLLSGDARGAVAAMEQAVLTAPEEIRFKGNLDRALAMLLVSDAERLSRQLPVPPPESPPERSPPVADPETVPESTPAVESPGDVPVAVHAPAAATDPVAGTVPQSPEGDDSAPSVPEPTDPAPQHPASSADADDAAPEHEAVDDAEPERVDAAAPEHEAVDDAEPERVDAATPEHEAGDDAEAEPDPGDFALPAPESVDPAPPDSAEDAGETPGRGDTAERAPEGGNGLRSHATSEPLAAGYVVLEYSLPFLQFGAFADAQAAAASAAALGALTDWPVSVSETRLAEGVRLHRVRVGPIPWRDALSELIETLAPHGYRVTNSSSVAEMPAAPFGTPDAWSVDDAGGRFLQVGAFAQRVVAEGLAASMRSLTDRDVRISAVAQRDGAMLYRVRIGPVESGDRLLELLSAPKRDFPSRSP